MKSWFIRNASQGLGAEIAKAALARGDRVVATAPRRNALAWARGVEADRMWVVDLDVTIMDEARAAVATALAAFGSIDVLVNNGGYGLYGFFEESSIDDAYEQMATNYFGVLNLSWAALPAMRKAGKGHIFNFTAPASVMGAQLGSLYCASKCAVEGFSQSLAREVAPFGIGLTIVEPGRNSSEFLSPRSACNGNHAFADYDERRASLFAGLEQKGGARRGDAIRLADAMAMLAHQPNPPLRLSADAIVEPANSARKPGAMMQAA